MCVHDCCCVKIRDALCKLEEVKKAQSEMFQIYQSKEHANKDVKEIIRQSYRRNLSAGKQDKSESRHSVEGSIETVERSIK